MPNLSVSDEQVFKLVEQMSQVQQESLFTFLLVKHWEKWSGLSKYGEEQVQQIAARRGLMWNQMSEKEREAFIDDLLHES